MLKVPLSFPRRYKIDFWLTFEDPVPEICWQLYFSKCQFSGSKRILPQRILT